MNRIKSLFMCEHDMTSMCEHDMTSESAFMCHFRKFSSQLLACSVAFSGGI